MKKISLIACAALIAGLLISCNSEAGVKDYNSVRYTQAVNNYVVSGTITTVEENSEATFDKDNKQDGGFSRKTTTTTKIKAVAGVVSYNTDSEFGSNYQEYTISTDREVDGGWMSITYDEDKVWDSTKKSLVTNPIKASDIEMTTGDPDTTVPSVSLKIYAIDGTFYYESNGQRWAFEADEDAVAAGEDFSINLTFTTTDETSDSTDLDEKGKQVSRETTSSKTTKTYNLTFTAK